MLAVIASMVTLALNSGDECGACSSVGAPFRGVAPAQRLTMGAAQKNQTTSLCVGHRAIRNPYLTFPCFCPS